MNALAALDLAEESKKAEYKPKLDYEKAGAMSKPKF
jgi:hypothetical protein